MRNLTYIIRITRDGNLAWVGYAERMPERFGNWRGVLDLLLGDHEVHVHDDTYHYSLVE